MHILARLKVDLIFSEMIYQSLKDAIFLDAIASPSTYPCQSVGEWVSDTGCFFNWYPPKNSKYKKLILARLEVSRPINVVTPNLGFPYFNVLGGYQLKKHPVQQG